MSGKKKSSKKEVKAVPLISVGDVRRLLRAVTYTIKSIEAGHPVRDMIYCSTKSQLGKRTMELVGEPLSLLQPILKAAIDIEERRQLEEMESDGDVSEDDGEDE